MFKLSEATTAIAYCPDDGIEAQGEEKYNLRHGSVGQMQTFKLTIIPLILSLSAAGFKEKKTWLAKSATR